LQVRLFERRFDFFGAEVSRLGAGSDLGLLGAVRMKNCFTVLRTGEMGIHWVPFLRLKRRFAITFQADQETKKEMFQ